MAGNRPGKKGPEILRVTKHDLEKGLELETGKRYRVTVSHSGHLAAVLRDETGKVPLAFRNYSVRGDTFSAAGVTDGEGALHHPGIPDGEYDLVIEGLSVRLKTVENPDEGPVIPVKGIRL